jgi:hypothetical protein
MSKIRLRVFGFVVTALLCGAVLAVSQNASGGPSAQSTTPPPAPRPQFFAGTVVELDASHIKVTRSLVGRPTESRSFAISAATKMNKAAIKVHSLVTVRYKRLPEGDVALEIQPRPVIVRTPKV